MQRHRARLDYGATVAERLAITVAGLALLKGMSDDYTNDLPDATDVVIWYLEERDGLDVYRVTKGTVTVGEFTGRSIGSAVFQAAFDHADSGRAVWLKDERGFRRLNWGDQSDLPAAWLK